MNCKFVPIILLLILSYSTKAQNVKLQIIVKNEKNELQQNTTAQILNIKDSSIYAVKILKPAVFFTVKKSTNYLLRITATTINPVFQNIQILDADTLLQINATTKSKKLDDVVVTNTKKLITQDEDKTIVDAEVLAASSTNGLEILEKTPGAIVDQDGNVYLNSATPASIYINGRELKQSPADIASLLKSIPASSISKIEILRNPSAKYDAASSGGIVNIILKKGVKLGVNGTVDVSYFQGQLGTQTIGFNVTKNDDKLNTYLSYNFTNRRNFLILDSERPLGNGLFIQDSYTKLPTTVNYAGGGLDYKVNSKLNIGYDVRLTINNNRSNLTNNINLVDINNRANSLLKSQSLVNNSGPTYFIGNTLSSKYKIDSLGSDWTNTLDYSFFENDNKQVYNNINILPSRNSLLGDGTILNKKNVIAFKSDVVLKTKQKIVIEFGTKLNFVRSNNNALYFADTSTGKYLNTFHTNAYKYNENIAALYVQVSKTIKGFTIKPGVRFEYTDIIGNQIIPANNSFKIKRTDIFPYLYLRRGIGKALGFKLTGNLIFRRSITRPFYEALNPFPRYADQYTYDVGNPNLKPQLTNNYEFNVTANEFPIFSVGLNDIQNIFSTLTYSSVDTLFRTYDNIGRNKEIYLRLVGGIPPGGKYFFYAGTQMNATNFDGQYNRRPFQFNKTSWNIFMFHSYKVNSTLNLSMNGFMRLNGVTSFFEFDPFGTLNFSATQSLLKKKLTLTLSANDILYTNKVNFKINVPTFVGNGINQNDTRRVGIAVKYNFGLKPRLEKRQGFDLPPELN